jgi:O-antigen ligase
MVYIATIIGLFAFIYLATWSHWAVIAYLVGIALFLWLWIRRRNLKND